MLDASRLCEILAEALTDGPNKDECYEIAKYRLMELKLDSQDYEKSVQILRLWIEDYFDIIGGKQ